MTSRQTRKRRARNERAARLPHQAIAVADPLVHEGSTVTKGASSAVLIAIGAVIFHGVAIGLIALASQVAKSATDRKANVEVAIVHQPPKPPPPPEPPKVEPPKEEPKKEEPKPVKKVERPPIPRDPIDKPKEPPKPEEKPKEVRRIVGLSLESTTNGGGGPSFATGNTRMGETEKTAAKPDDIAPLSKNVDDKPVESPNKAATRIPVAGTKFVAPTRKKAIRPDYPERARQAGIEGDVVVRVTIDASGKPIAAAIVKGAELEELNQAAKEAAMREEFTPATRDGVAIEYTLTYTYFFRLNG